MIVQDAVSTTTNSLKFIRYFSENRINSDLLKQMVSDLDEQEIISIIFLMTDKNTNISELIESLEKNYLTKFIELNKERNWKEKLLEILFIIRNQNVIRKLGYNANEIEEMENRFLINETFDTHNVTINLNRVIKSLYFLCENLNKNEMKYLIDEVNKELKKPIQVDETKIQLERYILHWLQQGYCTINEDNPNMNNLISKVKICCNLPFNFDYWKNTSENEQNSSHLMQHDNSFNSLNYNNHFNEVNKNIICSWTKKHEKLCIIINEMNFIDTKYDFRKGSEIDELNLQKTFEGSGFKIQKYLDLTKEEMMTLLESLNEHQYREFGCIFMCILSHGYEGEVLFSNNETISIKTIEKMFCCSNLQNVFKFVILQSCQGKQVGLVNQSIFLKKSEDLVTDGSSPIHHLHFGLFQATINDYAAVRDKKEGTWFIIDVCQELRESTPIKVNDWVVKVIARVSSRRSKSTIKDMDIIQIPRISHSIIEDYTIPKYIARVKK